MMMMMIMMDAAAAFDVMMMMMVVMMIMMMIIMTMAVRAVCRRHGPCMNSHINSAELKMLNPDRKLKPRFDRSACP